jgi:nucleotide-binding universal stress UspA family protein
MGQKILVSFDDSENAMKAVEFIATSFTKEQEITLFSVIPDTAAICDMNSPSLTPYFISKQTEFCVLEDQKKELVNEALQKAKELLLKAGFEEKNITIKVETRKKGVVRKKGFIRYKRLYPRECLTESSPLSKGYIGYIGGLNILPCV